MTKITDGVAEKYDSRQKEGRAGVSMAKTIVNIRIELVLLLADWNAIMADSAPGGRLEQMQGTLTPVEQTAMAAQAAAAQTFIDACEAADPSA